MSQAIGFVVAKDVFGGGIEPDLAADPDGDIGQVIDADGAMGGFRVATRRFSGFDGFGKAEERLGIGCLENLFAIFLG
jgi:hypothetical protein